MYKNSADKPIKVVFLFMFICNMHNICMILTTVRLCNCGEGAVFFLVSTCQNHISGKIPGARAPMCDVYVHVCMVSCLVRECAGKSSDH